MLLQIKNIPKNTSRQEIKRLFGQYGRVSGIIRRQDSAFIHMISNRRAEFAKDDLDGIDWKGNTIHVKKVKKKPTTSVCSTPFGVARLF